MTPDNKNARLTPVGLPGRRGRISAEKPKNSWQAILRLWHYLKLQKSLLVIIMLLLLINTAATLTGSYLLRPIINQYIIPHHIRGL